MGTVLRVIVNGPNAPARADEAVAEVKRLEKLFNRFDTESEVSQINQNAGRKAVRVSTDTFNCIKTAKNISRLSHGAFDITLGNDRELILRDSSYEVYLRKKGARLDLGGIGKGYAVESARKRLLKSGAKSGMINMRSSIAVFGEINYKIGILHPREKDKLLGAVNIGSGESLSTSGDYERGKHILDPKSEGPATKCQGVTVLGRDAAETDALSTAVFVLGPEKGIQLVEALPGNEVIIVDSSGRVFPSAGFKLVKE